MRVTKDPRRPPHAELPPGGATAAENQGAGQRVWALTPSSGPQRRQAAVTWALPSAGLRGTASQSGSKSPAQSGRGLGHRRAAARGLDSGLQAERGRAGGAPPRHRPALADPVTSRRRAAAAAAAGTESGFWLCGRALRSFSQPRQTPSRVRTLTPGPGSCWSWDFCNCWYFGGLVFFFFFFDCLPFSARCLEPKPPVRPPPSPVHPQPPGSGPERI